MEKTKNHNIVATMCKILGNMNRLRIITCLEKKPYSFGELLKELVVNPKVLNDHLNVLIANKLVAKSYPYGVYILTPAGHVTKQGLDAFAGYITRIADVLKEE
ncbi:MAG: winged helix-turn-helix transcriptional regulator [archaeon]|nr:winged helix-turn-helix transcriptional regulator [archaeon]